MDENSLEYWEKMEREAAAREGVTTASPPALPAMPVPEGYRLVPVSEMSRRARVHRLVADSATNVRQRSLNRWGLTWLLFLGAFLLAASAIISLPLDRPFKLLILAGILLVAGVAMAVHSYQHQDQRRWD